MQLIFDNLSNKFSVRQYGRFSDTALSWPEIYSSQSSVLAGMLYVVSAQELPDNPHFCSTCLIICAGKCEKLAYKKNRFPFLEVEADFAELLSTLLNIYNKYEQWEKKLMQILNADASVEKLLQVSLPLFENPINLIDRQMKLSIVVPAQRDDKKQLSNPLLTIKNIEYVALEDKYANDIRERIQKIGYDTVPRFCDDYLDAQYFCCIDLFYGKQHIGVLGIIRDCRDIFPSDGELLQILAKYVESAFQKHSIQLEKLKHSRKEVILELLCNRPISDGDLQQMVFSAERSNNHKNTGQYFCFKAIGDGERVQPHLNLCKTFETKLTGCIALEYKAAIVGIMDMAIFPYSNENFLSMLETRLQEMHLCAGISVPFFDLRQMHTYYRQACIALDMARTMKNGGGGGRCFRFVNYCLVNMLQQCTGEFPLETFCNRGLLYLWNNKDDSKTDYWNVLRVYLNTGCNASETARLLYMHRSTLLKRLNRIFQILKIDFHDSAQVLQLQIWVHLLSRGDNRTATDRNPLFDQHRGLFTESAESALGR
jgi:hypothetical protein